MQIKSDEQSNKKQQVYSSLHDNPVGQKNHRPESISSGYQHLDGNKEKPSAPLQSLLQTEDRDTTLVQNQRSLAA